MTENSKELSDKIIAFIDSHPFITITRLEKKLKIPKTTISHAKNYKRQVPKKYLETIRVELEKYGFV